MISYTPLYLYLCLALGISTLVIFASMLFPSKPTSVEKFLPYESGIITETHLLQERFPLRHYIVALIFLVFDVEVIFLYPWAVIAKEIGSFAFYEMLFFLLISSVGYIYVWRKNGLGWE